MEIGTYPIADPVPVQVLTLSGELDASNYLDVIERVREAGMEVDLVVAIFDRMEGGREAIEAIGVEVQALLTRKDIQAG